MTDPIRLIEKGVDGFVGKQELVDKIKSGKTLRIKAGFDPTAPDLHLGHTVLINKMRQFQDLGHEVVFLIGDFTGMIGDPSGRNVTRKPLTSDQVKRNADTYAQQVFKILDPDKTQVRFNSEWMSQKTAADMVALASTYTVARMLERDDFENRYKNHQSIAIHEFMYPLIQGYDSVALESDVELGGTDQRFNLLVGRELQRHYGMSTCQSVLTMPLVEGTDGVQKMSKSYDNYIGITETADSIFGKIMSISDELMWRYYELLSLEPPEVIDELKAAVEEGTNPRDVKERLALELAGRYHSEQAAQKAKDDFNARFKYHIMPQDLEEQRVEMPDKEDSIGIIHILRQAGLISSNSEGNRMLQQGAVKINGDKITSRDFSLTPSEEAFIAQVGKKRIAKIKITNNSC